MGGATVPVAVVVTSRIEAELIVGILCADPAWGRPPADRQSWVLLAGTTAAKSGAVEVARVGRRNRWKMPHGCRRTYQVDQRDF